MINIKFSFHNFYSYKDFLYPPASIAQIGPSAWQVVSNIRHNTTPDQFDKLCEKYPNYNIQTTYKDAHNRGFTAIHQAISDSNLELTAHIIKKFGKRVINLGSILPINLSLHRYDKGKTQNSEKIVELLIKSGAELNRERYSSTLENAAIMYTMGNCNIRIVKLLIQYGAQELVQFNPTWNNVLKELRSKEKDIDFINHRMKYQFIHPFIFEQQRGSQHSTVIEEVRKQINEEKFIFFSGLKDANSPVSKLSREIVATILTYEQILIPNIRQKAEKLLAIAKFKTVYENESLFFCGHKDEYSIFNILPLDVFNLILKTKIALNKGHKFVRI